MREALGKTDRMATARRLPDEGSRCYASYDSGHKAKTEFNRVWQKFKRENGGSMHVVHGGGKNKIGGILRVMAAQAVGCGNFSKVCDAAIQAHMKAPAAVTGFTAHLGVSRNS